MESITEVTRRNIIDSLLLRKIPFHGRLDIIEFLKRIWDLSPMPSSDIRYKNAEGDLWQHVINNSDYDYDYLLYKYFDLLNCDDDTFLKFLEVCLHPIVLTDEKQVSETLSEFNNFLTSDGFKLEVSSQIKVITFSPSVFNVPEKPIDPNLVSVMMPFKMENNWNNSTIVQDIFELICCS